MQVSPINWKGRTSFSNMAFIGSIKSPTTKGEGRPFAFMETLKVENGWVHFNGRWSLSFVLTRAQSSALAKFSLFFYLSYLKRKTKREMADLGLLQSRWLTHSISNTTIVVAYPLWPPSWLPINANHHDIVRTHGGKLIYSLREIVTMEFKVQAYQYIQLDCIYSKV